ncbi:Response regulator receiver domain-containing protein [Algoriphagus locisalis]|uniref:Response regulator receiver domain-containing protein n=1 Tax=Algoriphagus locisalis TaxID=305507 RepID=A0A1I7BAK2_9BACT|nr:response regulator [Algoriphagus locisalis]SFT84255.1 Response regulator receiver domain-containing protein [Algoriphagus locisalis]
MRTELILVDDDPISLLISKHLIEKVMPNQDVLRIKTFDVAVDCLSYLSHMKDGQNVRIGDFKILLDINMPEIDGWRFLGLLDKIDPEKLIKVVIHSSSKNPKDMEFAFSYSRVVNYIPKPMDNAKVLQLKNDMNVNDNHQNNMFNLNR